MNGELTDEGLTGLQRAVLVATAASLLLAFAPIPFPMEILSLVGIALGWWLVPGFWWTAIRGAIGGVVAGILILGLGFRAAMRVVALLEPARVPEFTIEGTSFILIFIGAIFGGILGISGNLAKRGLRLGSIATAAIVPALGAMALILVKEETRTELFELGAGAWVNIPMFALVSYLYGLGAAWLTRRPGLESRATPVTVSTGVPT